MASLSIFDDDRSATPDYFYRQSKDPLACAELGEGRKELADRSQSIDHDLNNYRKGLWSFNDRKGCCEESSGPECMEVSCHHGNDTSPEGVPKPALRRWVFRFKPDGTRQWILLPRKQRLEQAPLHEQVYDGYKVWNVNHRHQQLDEKDINSLLTKFDYDGATSGNNTSSEQAVDGPTPETDQNDQDHDPTQSLLPDIAAPSPDPSILQGISTSQDESISEINRKSVARKQYYARCGLLWECAVVLLEDLSIHPTNLTVYEFTKLVCLQGYEIFQWLATNRSYFVNRAETQWHQANSLLRNNASLDGLNANFMDDFLWMEADDQVSFIRSYKRLQLEAMALREGVNLPKTELDALCMMSDEYKLSVIEVYKNEAVQAALQQLRSLCSTYKDSRKVREEVAPVKADNLHLKFLFGLGQEKAKAFQDLVGMNQKPTSVKKAPCGLDVAREKQEVETSTAPIDDATQGTSGNRTVTWDVNVSQRSSESSNSNSEAWHSCSDRTLTAPSLFDISDATELYVHKPILEHIEEVGLDPINSHAGTLVDGIDDFPQGPQFKRHKISFSDLRGLVSSVRLESSSKRQGSNNRPSSDNLDDGSDWDFDPPKSLRKKASKLLGTFKNSLTWSTSRKSRRTVQNYF